MARETFTSNGTFTVPAGVTSVNVLVVAGGGSAGRGTINSGINGGGGGAGGLIYIEGYAVTPEAKISVVIGVGGVPNTKYDVVGTNGGNSQFGSLTAIGGGAGGAGNAPTDGVDGGSGGGAAVFVPYYRTGGTGTQPAQGGDSGTYGFGNAGGTTTNASANGGGGGGAGGVGVVTAGGAGKTYSISGSAVTYAAGGAANSDGGNGTANTGNGGRARASSSSDIAGYGGSGIVIVEWEVATPHHQRRRLLMK